MHTIRGKSLRTYSSPMAHLLFSNSLPSDSEKPIIQGLIANAEEALLDFDQQAATVRAKLAQYLDFHRSLLSPIRRLPEDVLLEIFEHGCAESRRTVFDFNSMPWLLTRVCSNWRLLVRSSPTLWRFFRTVAKDYCRYKESHQLEIASEFLQLSGQCPLHISIESVDVPFLHLLISHGMRWQTASMPPVSEISRDIPVTNFPLLRRVTIMDEPDGDFDDFFEVDIFQNAPLLTAATIYTEGESLFKFRALTHLTVLCLGDDWVDVVRQLKVVASTLTCCTLSFQALDDRRDVLRLPPLPDVTLPHLLSLTVREPLGSYPSERDYSTFLGHLTLPLLTSLAFHTVRHHHNVADAVVSLIRRSRCSLTSLAFNSREMAPILRLTSCLTHLTLNLRTIANGDFKCLMRGDSSPLVPKLEVVTLDVGAPFEYKTIGLETDSKYVNPTVDIIESRCPHDIETLKGGADRLRVLRFLSPEYRNHFVIQKITSRLKKEQERGLTIEYINTEVNIDEVDWPSGSSEDDPSYSSDSDGNW